MNPASRILAIYDKAMGFPEAPGVTILKLWGSVFGIADEANHTHEDEITAALMALRGEVDLACARLAEIGCPERLYVGYFNRVRNLASATLLPQDWSSHRRGLQSDIRLSLEWASWSLPKEEEQLPADDLAALIAELDAIEQSLPNIELSSHLRGFISRQIDLIRSALRHYNISGIAQVEDALEQAVGAFTRSKAVIVADADKSGAEGNDVLKRFTGAIGRIADTADKVDKIRKGGESAVGIGRAVAAALDGVVKLIT